MPGMPKHTIPPTPRVDNDGVAWSEYVRVVAFPDGNPPDPAEPPIHVASRPVLFDGVMAPATISKDGMTVDLGDGGTVVTLHVKAEDVQVGSTSRDEEYRPHLIGGRRVCTPVGHGWDWVPLDPDDPDGWIVCSIFVAEVLVR